MHDVALGRALRTIRISLGLRQVDVAERAGSSQAEVSRLERGDLSRVNLDRLRRVLAAVDATLVTSVRWRGGELDRLLDEGHATLVAAIADVLRRDRWRVETEVTYSIFGERGSIDVLAWHAPTRTLLVIEVKTEITSVEETERRLDAKVRLASRIWLERQGEHAAAVARMLVVAGTATNRRRIARHAAIFDARYPIRGRAAAAWLRRPAGAIGALLFVAPDRLPGGTATPIGAVRVSGTGASLRCRRARARGARSPRGPGP